MDKILVPVDGSEHAALAASWASKLANQTGGGLTLLHAYDMTATETMGLINLSKEEIDEIKERQAAEAFDKARSVMGELGAGADSIVAVGNPADEIILAAKSQGYDHIVMGSRGLSPVKELLLGSVSDRVAREAHCPVTIIRG